MTFLIVLTLCAAFTFTFAKTLKMKIRVFDQNNSPLEAVRVEIETSIDIYVEYTNQAGKVEFKIKKTKNELPAYKAEKKGYRTVTGKVERNSIGNMIIKMEEK